ncbi:MAG: hypothetical protein QOK40_977 [Miltoncostaeaceae bacterium]|nr:hypothetical protein [Miltoncostaeaceae bacterium]
MRLVAAQVMGAPERGVNCICGPDVERSVTEGAGVLDAYEDAAAAGVGECDGRGLERLVADSRLELDMLALTREPAAAQISTWSMTSWRPCPVPIRVTGTSSHSEISST